jgi:hypothetical protein
MLYDAIRRTQRMNPTPSQSSPRVSERIVPVVAGGFAVVCGVGVLLGWFLDRPAWTDWWGVGISMLPNTALAIVLAGLAMVMLAIGYRRGGTAAASLVGMLGVATVFEHLTRVDLGIDTILVVREWGQAVRPLRSRSRFSGSGLWRCRWGTEAVGRERSRGWPRSRSRCSQ